MGHKEELNDARDSKIDSEAVWKRFGTDFVTTSEHRRGTQKRLDRGSVDVRSKCRFQWIPRST